MFMIEEYLELVLPEAIRRRFRGSVGILWGISGNDSVGSHLLNKIPSVLGPYSKGVLRLGTLGKFVSQTPD